MALKWTFYCRKYKIKTLEIINKINPNYYIDIGCGCEILNKVELALKTNLDLILMKNLLQR